MNKYALSSAQLNAVEQAPLASYESIKAKIDRGINRQAEGRKEVAEGIKEMIETEAYTKKYKTIAAFAEHEYGKSARWVAHQLEELLKANKVDKPESADPPNPTNGQDEPASAEVTTPAQPAAPAAPAKAKAVKPPMDLSGCVIPSQNLSALDRRDEIKSAMMEASGLKTLFESIQNKPDPLFAHVKATGSVQTFMTGAASMYTALRECLPDVVCPECGGKSAACHYCFASGWISEVRWNREWVKSNDTLKGAEVVRRAALKAKA